MNNCQFEEGLGRPVAPEEEGAYVWRFEDRSGGDNAIRAENPYFIIQPGQKNNELQNEIFASNNVVAGMVYIHDFNLARALKNESNINIVNGYVSQKDLGYVSQKDLAKMVSIDYHGYNIVDIEPLQYCINLRRCKLKNNQIRIINVLSKCIDLRELDLSGNDIIDISPLRQLKQIRILYLESNRIQDITPLCEMSRLRIAILSNNRIVRVEGLNNLYYLQYLELSYNYIRDISTLKQLRSLKILWIDNNPLQDYNVSLLPTQISIIVLRNTRWERVLSPLYVK